MSKKPNGQDAAPEPTDEERAEQEFMSGWQAADDEKAKRPTAVSRETNSDTSSPPAGDDPETPPADGTGEDPGASAAGEGAVAPDGDGTAVSAGDESDSATVDEASYEALKRDFEAFRSSRRNATGISTHPSVV